MGAAAYDLCMVASGALDGYWEVNLKAWDMAAGALCVEEAGGQVLPFLQGRGVSIMAGHRKIVKLLSAEWRAWEKKN